MQRCQTHVASIDHYLLASPTWSGTRLIPGKVSNFTPDITVCRMSCQRSGTAGANSHRQKYPWTTLQSDYTLLFRTYQRRRSRVSIPSVWETLMVILIMRIMSGPVDSSKTTEQLTVKTTEHKWNSLRQGIQLANLFGFLKSILKLTFLRF